MKVIIISGTPGTGKTTVSKKISNIIKAKVITLNELVIAEKLTIGYDYKRETSIIDDEKLISFIENLINKIKKENLEFLIIEGHFSDIVPENYIDYVFILRCDPDVLYKRLERRGYNKKKIFENIQSEILGNCVNFLLDKNIRTPLMEIDTTNLSIEAIINIIIDIIIKEKNKKEYYVGKVDWLSKLYRENRLHDFFN